MCINAPMKEIETLQTGVLVYKCKNWKNNVYVHVLLIPMPKYLNSFLPIKTNKIKYLHIVTELSGSLSLSKWSADENVFLLYK